MKNTNLTRAAASLLACGMVFGLTACSSSASSSEATAESAASSEAASESTVPDDATAESAADDYSYLADFSFSDAYDENGYLKGITALDYVTLPDTESFTLSDDATTVSDSDIDNYISNNILSNYKTTNEITNRAAENGDTVNIDFAGSIDGVALDGGTGSDYDLTLGSGTFIDGFEDQIVGHMPRRNL
ncbi:MAG: FKBP-type peptidyl-prolyl cis-trans isomerase [Subdoligranulum sp.]